MKKLLNRWVVRTRSREQYGSRKMFLKPNGDSTTGVGFDFNQMGALRFRCDAIALVYATIRGGRVVRLVRTECDSCGARPVVATDGVGRDLCVGCARAEGVRCRRRTTEKEGE